MSRCFGGRSVTSRSPIRTSPAVTSSRPATILRMVDLPHPDGPTRTMNSPSSMRSETLSTATTSWPKTLVIPSSTMSAISNLLWWPVGPVSAAPLAAGSSCTASASVEPIEGKRGPEPRGGRPAAPGGVQPDQRGTDHRRGLELSHHCSGRRGGDAPLDPSKETDVVGPEHPPPPDDVGRGGRPPAPPGGGPRPPPHPLRPPPPGAPG